MIYEATLLGKRQVKVRELETRDEDMAIKAIGKDIDSENPLSMKVLIKEFVKMMLVEVDGQPVTYQELSEGKLDNLFSLKEMRQLESLYNELHAPSEGQTKDFLLTIKPVLTQK